MESWKFTIEATGAVTMHGSGAYQTSPLAMEMNLDGLTAGGQTIPGEIRMRLVDGAVYMSMGAFTQTLGAEWIKISGGGSSPFADLTDSFSQQDPRVQMRLFVSADEATEVGSETLDGVRTTHYTATLDADGLGEISGLTAAEVDAVKESFTAAGISSMTYDVWVDESFRPRQVKINMPSTLGALDMTMKITDINGEVKIEAPPAEDVAELPTG